MAAPGSATITRRGDLTETLAFFEIRPDVPAPRFTAGQYVTIGLEVEGRLVERPYSVTSGETRVSEGYELYIRRVPGGALTPSLFATRVGDRVTFRGPKGRFTIDPAEGRTHLFVATGCGVAPFISMLRTMRDNGVARRIALLHGVSYVSELAYRLFLDDLAADPERRLTYVPTVSRPQAPENAGWNGTTGRAESVVGALCDRLALTPADCVAYICGNPEMTEATRVSLRDRGFEAAQIHIEEYWPARTERPG